MSFSPFQKCMESKKEVQWSPNTESHFIILLFGYMVLFHAESSPQTEEWSKGLNCIVQLVQPTGRGLIQKDEIWVIERAFTSPRGLPPTWQEGCRNHKRGGLAQLLSRHIFNNYYLLSTYCARHYAFIYSSQQP